MPTGFVPQQDKQYLVAFAQLPEAATLDRTDAVIRRMGDIVLEQPGVAHAVAFPGLSINGFVNAPNAGIVFVTLDAVRRSGSDETLSAGAIAGALNQQFGAIQDAFVAIFPPPPVMGLGTDRRLQAADRGSRRARPRRRSTRRRRTVVQRPGRHPASRGLFSGFQVNVPQLDVEVDREKAKAQGVASTDLFETMQIYLGSLYVNDFNRFGRTYQVIAQADVDFRLQPEDIAAAQDAQRRRRDGAARRAS